MPRPVIQDQLQVYRFWLLDVAPIEPLALPIFTPLFGFSSITMPQIDFDVQEIKEGNWYFPRKVIKGANVSSITLQRGATFFDSDFWRWTLAGLTGDPESFQSRTYGAAVGLAAGGGALGAGLGALGGLFGFPRLGGPTYRRNLILIHFFSHQPVGGDVATALFAIGGSIAAFAGLSPLSGGVAAGLGALALTGNGNNAFDKLPARAWQLKGCIPKSYKPGGDFEASSSDVSLMEMELEIEEIEEISLAA